MIGEKCNVVALTLSPVNARHPTTMRKPEVIHDENIPGTQEENAGNVSILLLHPLQLAQHRARDLGAVVPRAVHSRRAAPYPYRGHRLVVVVVVQRTYDKRDRPSLGVWGVARSHYYPGM